MASEFFPEPENRNLRRPPWPAGEISKAAKEEGSGAFLNLYEEMRYIGMVLYYMMNTVTQVL